MKVVHGDILEIKTGIICHQVNAKGVMGAGLAKHIRAKFPMAYTEYRKAYIDGRLRLGFAQLVKVSKSNLYIANLCGQDRYGYGKKFTDYAALQSALSTVQYWVDKWYSDYGIKLPIYIPFNMGCGLAGGKWKEVLSRIKTTTPEAVIVRKS